MTLTVRNCEKCVQIKIYRFRANKKEAIKGRTDSENTGLGAEYLHKRDEEQEADLVQNGAEAMGPKRPKDSFR